MTQVEPSTSPPPPRGSAIDETRERRMALWLTVAVLATLTAVKPLGGIPVIGTLGFTLAAALQLYLPLWRLDRLHAGYAFIGLHLHSWRRDLRIVGWLCLIAFPPYAVAHHFYMTAAHDWALGLGLPEVARLLPTRVLAPHLPVGVWAWTASLAWFGEIVATHALGVALPEETFYRGYLLPRLETRWPPHTRVFGVRLGSAAVLAAALFAAGHFLGEWNPLRLGPFFPALVFSWQRNKTGSVFGAIAFHATCNVFGQLLFVLYR